MNSLNTLLKNVSLTYYYTRHFTTSFNFCQIPTNLLYQATSFKSIYSLDKIYPNSNLNFAEKVKPPINQNEFTGYIPINKIQISTSRSSKPGGQHVNKTNSRVTISFKLSEADWIPSKIREKLASIHKNQINKEGMWLIRSEKTRMQALNLSDCLDKLRCYITEAAEPPEVPDATTLEMRRLRYEKATEERLKQKRHKKMLKMLKQTDYDE